MSQEELEKLIDAALRTPSVSTEDGIEAAKMIFERARLEKIDCALAGGIAMHLYGYQRATHDVDLLASDQFDQVPVNTLSFGGASYTLRLGPKEITIDLIVRTDFFRSFYEAALRDASEIRDGLRIVTPEWMVILKFLSRRSKDILDLLWLLRAPGLVDREKIKQLLIDVSGETGAQVALAGLEPYFIQADVMRAGDEKTS
jgi:hypothetical protein